MSNGYASLPLQRKVALTLLLTISAFAAISYLILSTVVAPAFEDLELEAARSDLVRSEQAIQRISATLRRSPPTGRHGMIFTTTCSATTQASGNRI